MEEATRGMSRYFINRLNLCEDGLVISVKQSLSVGGTLCYSGRANGQHTGRVGLVTDKATKCLGVRWFRTIWLNST